LNNKETEVVVKEQKERDVDREGESRERRVELLNERSKRDETCEEKKRRRDEWRGYVRMVICTVWWRR